MVDLQATPFQQLEDSIKLLNEHKIIPKQKESEFSDERRVQFIPMLVVVNKDDDDRTDDDFSVFKELLEIKLPLIPISVLNKRNLINFEKKIFHSLELIRIYSKPPGKEADLTKPFVVKKGSTLEEFAGKVHHDFQQKLKTARVWGQNVYDGQLVGKDHILNDRDIVELHL